MQDGVQYKRSLPLLVAEAFVPHEINQEEFDTPINVNGDRSDNRADNLIWRPRWFAVEFNRQFQVRSPHFIDMPLKDVSTQEVFPGSIEICTTFGLLEKDVVLSVLNRTFTWPTFQRFGFA